MKKLFSKFFKKKESVSYGKEYIVDLIRRFIADDPKLGPYKWDDFISITIKDDENPYEAWIQRILIYIEWYFASRSRYEWCHPLGIQALSRLADAIESDTFPFPPTDEEKEELNHEKIPARYRKIFFGDCDPGVS